VDAIRYEVNEGVATLTLHRPAQKNAIDETMRSEVAQVLAGLSRDRDVRALVITGAGGAFCTGGDLRSIATANLDTEGWRQRLKASHAWLNELISLDRPIVAAVDGAAYGAGFSLALAADFILASPRARFCMSFLRIGLVPDFGAFYTLPRVVGVQRAKELMLSARDVSAEEAKALGIVMEIQPGRSAARTRTELGNEFCPCFADGRELDQTHTGCAAIGSTDPAGNRSQRASIELRHRAPSPGGGAFSEKRAGVVSMAG
jgi:2-(1,2-epoxy-1,2-dihydrophenyl)acetyl-CoA isomerase